MLLILDSLTRLIIIFLSLIRQLEAEIAEEWTSDQGDKLLSLIKSIVAFDMKHNAEIQACDLLMEINRLDLLQVDKSNYLKVCLYLIK